MKIEEINFDLDGVMYNFDDGVRRIAGGLPHEVGKKEMWKAIARSKNFFETLELLPDAMELWTYVHSLDVVKSGKIKTRVLTGLPTMNDGANQKKRAVARDFGEHVECIVLPSKNKYMYAGPGKVLIDDRTDMISAFSNAGGIGILHRSAIETIGQLNALGL